MERIWPLLSIKAIPRPPYISFNLAPVLLESSNTWVKRELIWTRPLDALLAFLVTSVIEVSIPRVCSNVVPLTDNTALTLPKLFAKSADDTAKLFDFVLKFEKGRIVDFTAKEGEETLRHLIETDEGSHYLGEIALVPYSSPISDTNTVFYNTLYDENASCHFAIGSAYSSCIEGGNDIAAEDFDKYGINDSLTHVDFMVGSADLDIVGITHDGEEIQIFKDGNWAF